VSNSSERYHALDGLRAFAMFLGILLHVAISFMVTVPAFWPVRDNAPTPLADLFLLTVHDFRMQLFFLLSGFFGCLLYQRYGLAGLLGHRLKRVALPLVLGALLIVPSVVVPAMYAELENVRAAHVRGESSPMRAAAAELVTANPDSSDADLIIEYYRSGAALAGWPLVHLWFLYDLLVFAAAVSILAPALGRLSGTRVLARTDAAFRWIVANRWRVPVLAALTFPLMLPMKWIVDTPSTWNPQWHIVGYYFAFFAVGWMLFRHRDLVPTFGGRWVLNLVLANVLVLPVMLGVIVTGAIAEREGAEVVGRKLAGFALAVVYTWLMIAGLWGASLRLLAHASDRGRYLADASYWCYLASIAPIVVFQFLVRDWEVPGLLKAALVTAATMAVLLVSYEWGVRYTLIGAILNGRKYRTPPEPALAPALGPDRAGSSAVGEVTGPTAPPRAPQRSSGSRR
jgi:peptidoglycan/LPS O-acetylase OafA/YrhL